MHINFTPKRKCKRGKLTSYPSLIIENDVIEYSFIKSNTVISVYLHVDDICKWNYDKSDNILILNGRFSIASRNIATGNETLSDFRNCFKTFSFKYEFINLKMFLEIIKAEKCENLSKEIDKLII